MSLTPIDQVKQLVSDAKHVLVLLPRDPSTDAIASGLALYAALEKLGKEAKVVCNEFRLPPNHQFLPKSEEIARDLSAIRKFIIKLDVSRVHADEVSYDISDGSLNIYVTPKNGFYEERDVTTSAGDFAYDLIVVVDASDLDELGGVYDDNAEFFYHTPIINIDHKASNEHFGQVNYVEVTATSSSELVFELIRSLRKDLLDEYLATSLLAGIISKTKSFQAPSITPKSLSVASYLIESGARRDEIIKHLYQTKSISTLKIWGRALARLKTERNNTLVWTILNAEDFRQANTTDDQLDGVIDELMVNTPEAQVIILFYETPSTPSRIQAIIRTPHSMDALTVFQGFSPIGSKDFTRISADGTTLQEFEQKVIGTVHQHLA